MLKRLETRAGGGDNGLAVELASQLGLSVAQVGRAGAEVRRRAGLEMQRMALSRGGLADLVAGLGDERFHGHPQESADRLLLFLFGSDERARALVSAVGHRAQIPHDLAQRLVPRLVYAQFKELVERTRPALNEVFGRMPSLFQWSLGNMHADIAGIIRRRCGAGPYNRATLRRRVRAILAEGAGFATSSATGWYAWSLLAPARAVTRAIVVAMQPKDAGR